MGVEEEWFLIGEEIEEAHGRGKLILGNFHISSSSHFLDLEVRS